jgi:hypothetical protein
MVERLLIAGIAFTGHGYLAPLVLLPRRLARLQRDSDALIIRLHDTTHWAETLLGMGLALMLGWLLRFWLLAP